MAKQTINIGSSANDGTGDPLRTAFDKINDNFTELYGADDDATNFVIEDTSPQLGGNLDINGFNITSARSNEDIRIIPSGTGGVLASAVRIAGTTLSSDDSSAITVAEALQINGATNIDGAATATSTLAVTGATTLSSTLAVTGTSTFSDGVTAESLVTNTIQSNGSNADLSLQPSGTGDVLISALRVNGTTLDSSDSTKVTIAEAVDITGATDIGGALTGTSASFSTTLGVTGAATLSSTLAVTGGATLSSTLAVTGTSTFSDGVTAESIITNSVTSNGSNADISIQPSGTGDVILSALRINGTTLDSSDSTKVTIAEAVDITGATTVGGTLGVTGALTGTSGSFSTTLGVTGAATLSSTLAVTGTSTFSDGVTAESLTTNAIFANGSNADISIQPSGTGDALISALRINGTTLSSSDSTLVTIAEALDVTGATTLGSTVGITGAVTCASTFQVTGTSEFNDGVTCESVITNKISSNGSNADISIQPSGTGDVRLSALRVNGTTLDSSDSTKITIAEDVDITGALAVAGQTTLTGSFLPAIHTFTATDSITEVEHAGRTLLLGEVGGNALVTLTLPDATGSGAVYKFIVTVANTSNYVIKVPDADNTIAGIMLYLDEDGTAVTAFPTVAASDTITLNGGTTGGIVGDYLEIVDIAADKYHVRGVQRVAAGANPATPFSATVS